jgi:cytoskeletal protein CcmA (bactofilin family)
MALGRSRDEAAREPVSPADAETILSRDAKFAGKLVFEGVVRVDGKLEGEVVTEDLLVVGSTAEVKGTLRVGTIIINGLVEGDIIAATLVDLRASGRVRGNIIAPTMTLERGGTIDGTCKMARDADAKR